MQQLVEQREPAPSHGACGLLKWSTPPAEAYVERVVTLPTTFFVNNSSGIHVIYRTRCTSFHVVARRFSGPVGLVICGLVICGIVILCCECLWMMVCAGW